MKRLRDITTRASLHELVEALIEATVVDGETAPEVKPEGEKEFVKLHKTEKHTDPDRLGNPAFSHKVKEAPYKKAPKDNGFPKEVKEEEEIDEAHPAWPNKSRHPSMRKPANPIGKKKSGKWETREDDQGNVFFRRVGSKKWDTTRRTDEELDESGAIAKAKGKAVLISRPKFDARGNVVLTKVAKQNITYGKKPRKLTGKTYRPGEQKRFGEEKEQLDEGGPTKKHFKMAADTIRNLPIEKRREHAEIHADMFAKSNPRFNKAKFYDAAGVPIPGAIYDKKTGKIREEKEQLDELSPATLGRYIKGREPGLKVAAYSTGAYQAHGQPDWAEHHLKQMDKYSKGIRRAADRISGTYEVGKDLKVMIPGKGDNDKASGPYTIKKRKIYHGNGDDKEFKDPHEPHKTWKSKKAYYQHNTEETQLDEKAVSKAQQRLFGMAYAMRKGESDRGSEKVASLAADLSKKKLRDFAKTKHKGLPERKEK